MQLVRGNHQINPFNPDLIQITSLFTYWSKHVWESVEFYRSQFPKAEIEIGGIYATLMHDSPHFVSNLRNFKATVPVCGVHREAEKCLPAYDLVDVDYQIIHGMRGCVRKCKFCGTWKIEPEPIYKTATEIAKEITTNGKDKIIFYDNNFLANPYVKDILLALSNMRVDNKAIVCESQSGFDGRLLNSETALLLKEARFQNLRIAWDGDLKQRQDVKRQIDSLCKAGYQRKDIFVFMIYNWDVSFEIMEKKRKICHRWGVQISDCRYRPLDQLYDNYNPQARKGGQTAEDYYIHTKAGWGDKKVRQFRRNVRRQNIGIRYGNGKYVHEMATTYSMTKRLYKQAGIKKVPKLWQIKRSAKLRKQVQELKKSLPTVPHA